MLYTNLKHIEKAADHQKIITENENVMICCGRMGPACIPVYRVMEELEDKYSHVEFFDMEFDNPQSQVIRSAPECRNFMRLPFVVYYKNGNLVKATASVQNIQQVKTILDSEFGIPPTEKNHISDNH